MKTSINERAAGLFTAWMLAQAVIAAQALPPAFPRAGSTKVLENARVIIWDATWLKNRATPVHEHPVDYLSVTLVEGAVKMTARDGTSTVAPSRFGVVRFSPTGTIHAEEGVTDPERRAIMVELKTGVGPTSVGGPGQPFPREGAIKGLENDRVSVWDYTWTLGHRVPRHQQPLDTVIVFLKGGVIRQLLEQGSAVEVRRTAGDVVYVPAGSEGFSEEAMQGPPRAVYIQLK